MNEQESAENRLIDELLKKSLIKLPSENFTDRLMEKIEAEKAHEKLSFLSIKLSWVFLTIAVIMVPLSLRLITETIHQENFLPYIAKISPALLLLFSFLVLFQLDNLLKTFFGRKKIGILFGDFQ